MHIKASRRDRNDQEKSSPIPAAPWVVLSVRIVPFLVQVGKVKITSFSCSGVRTVGSPCERSLLKDVIYEALKFLSRHHLERGINFTAKMLYAIQLWINRRIQWNGKNVMIHHVWISIICEYIFHCFLNYKSLLYTKYILAFSKIFIFNYYKNIPFKIFFNIYFA